MRPAIHFIRLTLASISRPRALTGPSPSGARLVKARSNAAGPSALHRPGLDSPRAKGESGARFSGGDGDHDWHRTAGGPARSRPDARAGRPFGHADAGRHGRRRHQGREARRRRRHAPLGPALREGQGRKGDERERLLPRGQPQQALRRPRHRQAGGPGHRPPPGGAQRRPHRELQDR